jgi:hypothetical protein
MKMTIARRPLVALAVVILASATLVACKGGGDGPALRAEAPLVVVSSTESAAWLRLLRSSGIAARVGTLAEALDRTAAVVPSTTDLVPDQRRKVTAWVERGGRLVTSHDALLDALGFEREATARKVDQLEVAQVGTARWPVPFDVKGLRPGGHLRDALPTARGNGLAVQVTSRLGKGRILALALDPFADKRKGYELFPWLGRDVQTTTRAPDGPARLGAEVYFDPGGLRGPPGEIAEVVGDVKAVHVAAWNFDFNNPADDYDYDALIAAMHAKGVLVYAWLEPPFVTLKFWDDHPECRERTGTGREAKVDWRLLIALEDPKCFQLAATAWTRFLAKHDFDGINVAELYFEPDIKLDNFTPFHPTALKRFGGDPVKDRDAFLRWRTDLVVELNDAMLRMLNGLPAAKGLDFQLTVIDDRLDPAHGQIVGSDITRLAEVAKANGASLQIEDPFTVWTEGPLRYDRLQGDVKNLMPAGQAYIDINVVDREDARPTLKMTGAELSLAAASAGAAGRLGVYSAGSTPVADLHRIPRAMAGAARVFDEGTSAPWTTLASATAGPAATRLTVDGKRWPASAGVAVVPPGEHRLVWSKGAPVGPGLVRLTAEIGSASVTPRSLTFRYDSRLRPLAVLDRKARALTVDGEGAPLDVLDGSDGRTVRLPAGNHTVRIETEAAAPSS